MRTVYLDYNATTPLDEGVWETMVPHMRNHYGNPSSIHRVGRDAKAHLDDARYDLSELWQCKPSEIVFTSGGTESNNLAIFGTARLLKSKGRHLVCSAVEHHAVLHCFEYLSEKEGFDLTILPVDGEGRVDPNSVEEAIREDTQLVSVMAANNEIGTIQPIAEIGAICRERGVLFHTDAVQWFGKEPVESIHQFNADLVSVCAHKLHGPKGSGALFIRSPLLPDKIFFGGAHENERRAGTENLAAIVGLVEALKRFSNPPVFSQQTIREANQCLRECLLTVPEVDILTPQTGSLQNTLSFTVNGCDSIGLLAGLDLEGICASSGSACSVGSLEPSHVVLAMGISRDKANALVRLSLGKENTQEDMIYANEMIPRVLKRCLIVK